ncbi:MAG: signal peptidase I [Planctomycetota bacterium]|jgi:signal peptidase I
MTSFSTARQREPGPADEGRFARRFVRDLCIGAVAVLGLHFFVVQISVVRGQSMAPSLRDGDRVVVDRVSYSMAEISRFDVVILRYPRDPSLDFVKRVIGLPGDRVQMFNGVVTVNGKRISEEFAHHRDVNEVVDAVVPFGKVFVLGDNRPISCDSRSFGMVGVENLRGKVRACFWPLDRMTFF